MFYITFSQLTVMQRWAPSLRLMLSHWTQTIMHRHSSRNTTVFAIIHNVSATCFSRFWFGHHQVGYNYQRNYI